MAQGQQDPSLGAPSGTQPTPSPPQSPAAPQSPQPAGGAPGGPPPSAGLLAGPLPRASFGQRAGALLIDSAILTAVILVVFFILSAIGMAVANTGSTFGGILAALIALVVFVLALAAPVAYFGYMEGQPSGQTLGKRALNIRVVDFNTGGPLTVRSGMLRNLVKIYLSGILYLGYLWMLWDPQRQTWHDKLVSTTVVPTSAYPV